MKYEVTPEACRVCLRKSRCWRSIFEPYEEGDVPPSEKLKAIASVNIVKLEDYPFLPASICKACEISLNMAYSFRNTAKKSDKIIQIYCNRLLNKDNVIVELDSGRKFKLPKELTLKIVKTNSGQKSTASPVVVRAEVPSADSKTIQVARDDFADTVQLDGVKEEDGEEDEEIGEDDLVYSDDDDSENEEEPATPMDQDDAEPIKAEVKPTPVYNAEEIAKQLQASNKYEVLSWNQDANDESSVPVFRLRRKLPETKNTSKDFICDVCGNTYNQRHTLMEHMRRHNKQKNFECEICRKCFAVAEGLRRHILTHGAKKPFKCNFCSRCFYTRSSRKAHEKVHNGDKPYVCKICSRAFAYSCSMQKHMLIHENKKQYRCEFCCKEFRLQHHLKQHEETQIHKDTMAETII